MTPIEKNVLETFMTLMKEQIMFYAVLALLQKISKVHSKHSGAIGLFNKEFVKKGVFSKDLSKDLHKAFELRQTVDYKIIKPVTLDRAEEIWNKADRFV